MAEWPHFAPVPPPAVRSMLRNDEWESCLQAWITLIEIRLEVPGKEFKEFALNDESAVSFLSSFYHELASTSSSSSSKDTTLHSGQRARSLRKLCFLLTRRFLLDLPAPPVELLDWKFLGDMCCCFPSSSALKRLLSETWNKDKNEETISSSLENAKSVIIKRLSLSEKTMSNNNDLDIFCDIRRLTILVSVLPGCGQVLITGSDFLDTFFDAYQVQKKEGFRCVLVANIYVGLTSLFKGPRANLSLLLDQLFSLKAAAGVGTAKVKREPTLLSDLICSSDLLARLERHLAVSPQKRGQDLVTSLRSYQTESKPWHHRYQRQKRKINKGKGRAPDLPVVEEFHAHRMSLVTQVQDLFPDLGSAYIIRLFDFYGDNPETVVAHLLDGSLPPELRTLDKSEQLVSTHPIPHRDPLSPQPTPPEIPSPRPTPAPTRKNIFDEDVDIAELTRSGDESARSKLRFGRANPDLTADAILADRSQHAANKAAIISALATFDSDDDERDDTYDVADVGGTIDAVAPGTDGDADADMRARRAEEIDMTLFRAYKSTPAVFARDSTTRRCQPRASLKRDTGLTDEAIEGWAVMLSRDPKRLSKLEHKLALAAGGVGAGGAGALQQPELRPTAYRKPGPEAEDEEEEESGEINTDGDRVLQPSRGGRGRGRGGRGGRRGGGGGGGRRGGGPGGSSTTDQNPGLSRQRKEENKASRANHNRRQQRAKKMARGGGLPG